MSIATIHPVKIGSTTLPGIVDFVPDQGIDCVAPITDGNEYPQLVYTRMETPGAVIASVDLKTAWDLLGLTGTTGTFDGWEIPRTADGSKSMSAAVKSSLASALVFVDSIEIPHNEPATIRINAVGYGSVMTRALSQTAPAFTPGSDKFHTLGQASINGVALTGMQSVSVRTGIRLSSRQADGNIVPDSVVIQSISPIITGRIMNPAAINLLLGGSGPYSGVRSLDNSNGFRLWIKKRAHGGYVANGTAEHMLLQAKAGVVYAQRSQGDPRTVEFMIMGEAPTSGLVLTLNTATAIT